MKKEIQKKYIDPYYKVLKRIKPKIGLKKKIEVKLANGWQFDISKKNKYVIYSPPYFKEFEPVFVHYLVHAKMLEDGWVSAEIDYRFEKKAWKESVFTEKEFEKKTEQEKEQIYFNLHNRSADSFFDFYVWNYVCNNLDKKYFLNFTEETGRQPVRAVIKGVEKLIQERGFKLHPYVMCLDWFAMFYAVSKNVDKKRAQELDSFYKKLFRSKKFRELVPANTKETIEWLREFYAELYEKCPNHHELIKNGRLQKAFSKYYSRVWKESGFKVKIKEFVKI